ncbi:MAG TPA: sulfotransferase [Natronosporangium sp.]
MLFLGGLGRSGTTLVERILGQLPGAVGLGEVVHLWQRDLRDGERCGCGAPFQRCAFWRAVGDHAFGGWHRVDVDRILHLQRTVERTRHVPRLALRASPEVRAYAGYYRRVYAAAAAVTGAELVIDSSKHSALAWCLRHDPALDLRVVQVIRDPRGVAYSWTKRVHRPESDGGEMTRYPPARSALLWNAQNAALAALGWCGTPLLRLRYERFLADPRAAVRALARFAGLDPAALRLDFLADRAVTLGPGHSAAGNPMRFAVGTVPLRTDDAWRRELPRRHRRLVGALCLPLLAAYRYPLR